MVAFDPYDRDLHQRHYILFNLLVILDETVALNKLSNFIGSMASEKKIVCWSYG